MIYIYKVNGDKPEYFRTDAILTRDSVEHIAEELAATSGHTVEAAAFISDDAVESQHPVFSI